MPKKKSLDKMQGKMRGGHYSESPAEILAKINQSLGFDRKLYAEDIKGSKAHAKMLARQKIISEKDCSAILSGLDKIKKEIESGGFNFRDELEDIHMNIENRLGEIIGAAAGKLRTARSRNDQVATDFKLWVRSALKKLDKNLAGLQKNILARAGEHAATIMPGFTHLQPAQPVTLGHHLLAYFEMFSRDRSRIKDALVRMNESPLGSAALAGTSFPIDRDFTAKELGFDRPMANSLDAVSDRDFALEYLALGSICAMHLSRMAEEIIIWSSPQFGFIKLSEKFTTGSSIMPQKRNPDAAELVRGKTGRIYGALVSLLTTMKALPLAYSKDMQEDKEPVFLADATLELCVLAMSGMIADFTADKKKMLESASLGFLTATDLADWLVKNLGLPFREAHHITGKIVALAEKKNCRLDEISLKEMQKIAPKISAEIFKVLSMENSVRSRNSYGGTSPEGVRKAIIQAKKT